MRRSVWLMLLLAGCPHGSSDQPDAAVNAAATAHFDPPPPQAGGDWGRVPFPSDLYLDATGHLALTTVPGGPNEGPDNVTMLEEGLASMTGAGLRSNVYFPIELDPGATIDGTTVAGAAVMLDLETMAAIDADAFWRDDLRD